MIDFSLIKTRLLIDYPFFGTIASTMETVVNDDIENFGYRDGRLEYREAYGSQLSDSQALFVLCNAALHEALSHTLRRGNRSPWLWNMACDYAINALLLENGFEMPPSLTYERRFENLSAEEIYAELSLEFLDQEQNDRDVDEGRQNESSDERLSRAQREHRVQEALGKDDPLEESILRLLGKRRFGTVDWKNELRDALGGYYVTDFVLIPPSKKLLYQGIYLPGAHSRHLEIAIAIDSSGSVDEELLNRFVAEVESVMESFGSYGIELIVCDERIRSRMRFENGDEIVYHLKGGGGTDFRPVFDEIATWPTLPATLLYFTDLDGTFPTFEPPYDVVWVTPESRDVPFGRMIDIGAEYEA